MTKDTKPVSATKRRLLGGTMLDRMGHAAITAAGLLYALPAQAGGSSMPWEAPLQSILESIEGPVAKIIAVIIIIVTGLTLAFGDTSGGFRRRRMDRTLILAGPLIRLRASTVVYANGIAISRQMSGHRISHHSEADK